MNATTAEKTTGAVKHLWTANEYLRAWKAGVFAPYLRTELIAGEIIEMSAQGGGHIRAVMKANERLRTVFAGQGHVRVQMTLQLSRRSVPEPDLLAVRGSVDDAPIAPAADDILLVVEVSDGTLPQDRTVKARLYAKAGIREYWIINLRERQVEVHRQPAAPSSGYFDVQIVGEGETVRPLAAARAALPLAVTELLPPAQETESIAPNR